VVYMIRVLPPAVRHIPVQTLSLCHIHCRVSNDAKLGLPHFYYKISETVRRKERAKARRA